MNKVIAEDRNFRRTSQGYIVNTNSSEYNAAMKRRLYQLSIEERLDRLESQVAAIISKLGELNAN